MKFTFPIGKLKKRGYTFQRLYARNYITYRKEFGTYKEYKIWLWSKDKQIEINDWYSATANVVEAFKANVEQHLASSNTFTHQYMNMLLNTKTKEVIVETSQMRRERMESDNPYPENAHTFTIYIPYFIKVVKEYEFLTKKR